MVYLEERLYRLVERFITAYEKDVETRAKELVFKQEQSKEQGWHN